MQTTQNTAKQSYPGLVTFLTFGQEMRQANSTTLPSPHGAKTIQKTAATIQ